MAYPSFSWGAVAADFTGDGKSDVLVRNTETGQWYFYEMDGSTVVTQAGAGLTAPLEWQVQ